MRGYVRGLIQDEVTALRGRLPDETIAEVERSLRRVYRKVLHAPTVNAQAHAQAGTSEAYLKALHTVMGIDIHDADAVAVIDAEALPLFQAHPDDLLGTADLALELDLDAPDLVEDAAEDEVR